MSKTRLTITISPEVLNSVDRYIDGKTIRNRSHAIETLLRKQLSGNVKQAIILAGGKPEALDHSLTTVAGRPVIVHLINLVHSYGIENILILTDQPTKDLDEAIEGKSGVQIISQPKGLGTAGALLHIKERLSAQPVLVLHGDIFTDINLSDLIGFHEDQKTAVTICVKPKLNQQEFGKVLVHGNRVTEFTSKPQETGVGMVNTGVYVINPSIFLDYEKSSKRRMLETDIFPQLAESKQLSGFLFEGIWYDVSDRE